MFFTCDSVLYGYSMISTFAATWRMPCSTVSRQVPTIARSEGQAFGATGAAWTVGQLQVSRTGGMRVRYRATADRMECASELVQPAEAVSPVALFVRSVQ